MEVELPHPVGVVVAHGLRDDPKFCRDFLGTVAFGYRLKDLKFTVDEEIWRILQWSIRIGDDVAHERRDCVLIFNYGNALHLNGFSPPAPNFGASRWWAGRDSNPEPTT